jgi:signal transduction histidine kinase
VNTVKHADATQAEIRASRRRDDVVVSVSDDGRGFDAGEADTESWDRMTFGLFSIRERFEVLGGSMALESKPGSGATISLVAPVSTTLSEGEG